MRTCQWIEPSEGAKGEGKGVLFFRNHNGIGLAPEKIAAPGAKKTFIGADSDNE